MKIAVCISGIPKNHKICCESIKNNLIKPYSCDVFCSFWYENEDKCQELSNDYDPTVINFENFNSGYKEEFGKWDFKYNTLEQDRDPKNILAMYYKIRQACSLRKDWEQQHNIKYDAIIRIRPDLQLTSIPDLPKIIKERLIYIPPVENYTYFGVNDQFFLCGPDTYDKIAGSMFDGIRKLALWLPIHAELYLSMFSFFQGFGTSTFPATYKLLNDGGNTTNNL